MPCNFEKKDQVRGDPSDVSKGRQTFRLQSKHAPLHPEMVIEMAGLPMLKAACYAPIIHSKAENNSRWLYAQFLRWKNTPAREDDVVPKNAAFTVWARV